MLLVVLITNVYEVNKYEVNTQFSLVSCNSQLNAILNRWRNCHKNESAENVKKSKLKVQYMSLLCISSHNLFNFYVICENTFLLLWVTKSFKSFSQPFCIKNN